MFLPKEIQSAKSPTKQSPTKRGHTPVKSWFVHRGSHPGLNPKGNHNQPGLTEVDLNQVDRKPRVHISVLMDLNPRKAPKGKPEACFSLPWGTSCDHCPHSSQFIWPVSLSFEGSSTHRSSMAFWSFITSSRSART